MLNVKMQTTYYPAMPRNRENAITAIKKLWTQISHNNISSVCEF